MFASIATHDRCDLFRVMRTDLNNWDRLVLTYPPCDYQTALKRARYYKAHFSQGGRYDFRVCNAD